MREMKDSGVEWIGEIPKDWETKRIKSVLCERNESNNPVKTDFILSLTNDRGVIPYTDKGEVGNKSKEDLTDYKLAHKGDIILNSMNIIIGSVALSGYYGCVSPVYYMLFPRHDNDDIRFYNYIFQTKELQSKLKGYGNGIMEIRMRIQMSKLNTVLLPVAPYNVQNRIANYLDNKCSQIDAIIQREQVVIEKLKEYKLSVITDAVTKGLDPNVEMKDSGIEWIGKIPKMWECKKLKFIANAIYKGNGITKEDIVENGDTPCVRYGEIYTKFNYWFDKCITKTNADKVSPKRFFEYGDLLFAGTGELIEEIGKNIVYLGKEKSLAGGDIIVVKHLENPIFMSYALSSIPSQNQKSFGKAKLKVVHISGNEIGNIFIALPPRKMQDEIADILKEKCNKIDIAIIRKQSVINKLTEYKKSLIYEVVTGKKEI